MRSTRPRASLVAKEPLARPCRSTPQVWRPSWAKALSSVGVWRWEAAPLSAWAEKLAAGRGLRPHSCHACRVPSTLGPKLRLGDMSTGDYGAPPPPPARRSGPSFATGLWGVPSSLAAGRGLLGLQSGLGRAGWGRGGVPARSEKKGRGAGSLSRSASWNCPRSWGCTPASARN